MKKEIKFKKFSSNKAIYFQVISNNKVILTNKKLFNNILNNNIINDKILSLYNDNKIKYNSLQYILFNNKKNLLSNNINNTNQLLIEYSIEGGLSLS